MNQDIWIWDLVHKKLTRLTFEKDGAGNPLWTPDGKRIAFSSVPSESQVRVYWQAADGTGAPELLSVVPERNAIPSSWASGGNTLVLTDISPGFLGYEIGMLTMKGDRARKALLPSKYRETQPQISPDGRWMAYVSDESGSSEVYVRPFPDVNKGGKWQISTSGGDSPLWSKDGRELLYRNGDAAMAVSVKAESDFSFQTPLVLFRGNYVSVNLNPAGNELKPWDISPDGKHFLMMKAAGSNAAVGEGPRRINIVLNWFEELKQRLPTGKK